MSEQPSTTPRDLPKVRLDMRSGGWVLLLALVISGVMVAIRLSDFSGAQGDSREFDLSTCLVDREQIKRGAGHNAIPPVVDPDKLTLEEVAVTKIGRRGKFLVSDDLVVGVVQGDEACAYPVRFLDWHEVVNDTLGGVPLAVTWSPLTGSAVVFDRRVEGQPMELASSGMLFNANLLLYDRNSDDGSLWSQLQARAVSGPAAEDGRRLRVLPADLARWADWRADHPHTRVQAPEPSRAKLLTKRDPYRSYRGSDMLRPEFPVSPLPPEGLARKEPVLAVLAGGSRRVYPLSWLKAWSDDDGQWRTRQGGVELVFRYRESPPTATVRAPKGEPLEAIPSYWFGWFATHADDAQLIGE